MYTSCGWFFDELSGLETVQVIQYAGRALQLAQSLLGDGLEAQLLERLAEARSNLPEHRDAAVIYRKFVQPAIVDLEKVAAHYAISSLFESYAPQARIYSYSVEREDQRQMEAGKTRLVIGRARFTSEVTRDSASLSYGVLHFGDHNLNGGVREYRGPEQFEALAAEASEAFGRADFPEVIRLMDRHFGESSYSLKSLFRDEQRKIVNLILDSTLSGAAAVYSQVYEHHAPLLRFLADLGVPLPRAFHVTAEFVLNSNLRRALAEEKLDLDRIRTLLDSVAREGVSLDGPGLSYTLQQTLERMLGRFQAEPGDLALLQELVEVAELARVLPFEVNLWRAQNLYYQMQQSVGPEFRARADQEAQEWLPRFRALGENLGMRVE